MVVEAQIFPASPVHELLKIDLLKIDFPGFFRSLRPASSRRAWQRSDFRRLALFC
jgi:hypothetical protein